MQRVARVRQRQVIVAYIYLWLTQILHLTAFFPLLSTSLYIKRGKVSVRTIITSVTLGVASSVANDVIMRMTSQ